MWFVSCLVSLFSNIFKLLSLFWIFLWIFLRGNIEQYVEENERLRAILGEWSNRAAKVLSHLFFQLIGERLSNPTLGFTWLGLEYLADAISKFDVLKLERALEAERISNLDLQKKITTLKNQSNASAEPTEHRGA